MKLFKHKKGFSLREMAPIAVLLVVVAITLSMGQEILGNLATGQTANSYERNATTDGQLGLDELSDWQDI